MISVLYHLLITGKFHFQRGQKAEKNEGMHEGFIVLKALKTNY